MPHRDREASGTGGADPRGDFPADDNLGDDLGDDLDDFDRAEVLIEEYRKGEDPISEISGYSSEDLDRYARGDLTDGPGAPSPGGTEIARRMQWSLLRGKLTRWADEEEYAARMDKKDISNSVAIKSTRRAAFWVDDDKAVIGQMSVEWYSSVMVTSVIDGEEVEHRVLEGIYEMVAHVDDDGTIHGYSVDFRSDDRYGEGASATRRTLTQRFPRGEYPVVSGGGRPDSGVRAFYQPQVEVVTEERFSSYGDVPVIDKVLRVDREAII